MKNRSKAALVVTLAVSVGAGIMYTIRPQEPEMTSYKLFSLDQDGRVINTDNCTEMQNSGEISQQFHCDNDTSENAPTPKWDVFKLRASKGRHIF